MCQIFILLSKDLSQFIKNYYSNKAITIQEGNVKNSRNIVQILMYLFSPADGII